MIEIPVPFRLRDRLVTPERNMIAGPDGEVSIEPKIMQVLCVLAGEPGRVFTRAELIDRVWGPEYGTNRARIATAGAALGVGKRGGPNLRKLRQAGDIGARRLFLPAGK